MKREIKFHSFTDSQKIEELRHKINEILLNQSPIDLIDSSNISWFVPEAKNAKIILGGNRSINLDSLFVGDTGKLIIVQDSVGNRTLDLPSNSKLAGTTISQLPLSPSPNAIDLFDYYYDGDYIYWQHLIDEAALLILENNEYKITYYEIVSGTSGTITPPTNTTINGGEFGLSGNAVLSKINGSDKVTFISPKTAGGTVVTASLNTTTGAWVASGTYTDSQVALIYSIKVKGIDFQYLDTDRIIETTIVDAASISYVDTGLALKEDLTNKSSSFTVSSIITYANTKALVDGLATKEPTITILSPAKGGTGVNNSTNTLTLGANTTISGGGTISLGGFTLTVPATGTSTLGSPGALGRVFVGTGTNTGAGNTALTYLSNILQNSVSVNGGVDIISQNANTGTSASASVRATNGTYETALYQYGTSRSTSGLVTANLATLRTDSIIGQLFANTQSSSKFWWSIGGTATSDEQMRLTTSGLGIKTQADANSYLQVGGSLSLPIRAVTAATSFAVTDYAILASGSPGYTVTLPTAVGITGRIYILKNTGGASKTLGTTGGQTIDGSASLAVTNGNWRTVQSDGANWVRIG